MTARNLTVRYLDLSDLPAAAGFMDGPDKRSAAIARVYPDFAVGDGESVLRAYVRTVAEDNGVTYAEAQEAVRNMADPIYSQGDWKAVSRWLWYIA